MIPKNRTIDMELRSLNPVIVSSKKDPAVVRTDINIASSVPLNSSARKIE